MDQHLLNKAYEAGRRGETYVFATIVEATIKGTPRKSGAKMLVLADGEVIGSIGGGRNELAVIKACQKALRSGQPELMTCNYFGGEGQSICGGQMKVFIEPFAPIKRLIICGGGHIALPLSQMGKMLGYHVTILDNRRAFANKSRFPHVDAVFCGPYAKRLARLRMDHNTFVVIVTQGNEYDFACLEKVAGSDAGYIGVISSKTKRIKFSQRLKEAGVNPSVIRRIRMPSGLDIGAQSPEEIAVSIMAELVQTSRKVHVGTDKFTSQ